jgi:hypothetical protein
MEAPEIGKTDGGLPMMSHNIDEMVWRALTEPSFREGILNGKRRELAAAVGLSELEQEAVMSVRADTLEAFASALCQ